MSSGISLNKLTAIKIAAAYALVAGLWMLFSNRFESELFSDILFVSLTAWMIYFLIHRDMGLIQRSEKALKESVARLEDEKAKSDAILSAIGDGICIFDADYKILYQNQAHKKFLGSHAGKYCYTAYAGNDTFCEGCPVNMTFGEWGTRVVEHSVPDGDGVKDFESAVFPLKDAAGKIVAGIEVVREITARKKAEGDLFRTKKLESIGVLARGFSHDFNNLLTGILGNISLAKTSMSPENDLFGLLTKAENACLRAEHLTNQLHAIAKSSESKKRTLSISGLIKESSAFALNGSAIKCTYHLPDELWPVMVDEGQISQAIYNIVANACDVMHGNGHIKISAENAVIGPHDGSMLKQGNYIKISIEDEGSGIEKELLPKIFDPYFTTKELGSDTGTGLSLSASYFAVKNHQGYIFAESTIGEGTNFCIYLPST